MKNLFKFCLVATMIFLPFSCDQDSIDADSGVENFNKATRESADEIEPISSDFPYKNVSATLVRNKNGVTAKFTAAGLEPGAYTIWVAVFNGECATEPCTMADFGNPEVEGDVLYGAGHVVGKNGKGNFSAHLSKGDESGSIRDIFGLQYASGLLNPTGAEIHLILRYHGPAIPGKIDEQIHTYEAGCEECEDLVGALFYAK